MIKMLLPCAFFFLVSIQASSAIDICGLEDVPKCTIIDLKCLENLEMAIRKWYQSPEAVGFLVKPVDPLFLDELDVTFDSSKITLKNITITGLEKSKINVAPTLLLPLFEISFEHNVVLKASTYTVADLGAGTENDSNTPFTATLNNLRSVGEVILSVIPRCDGVTHLSIDLQKLTDDSSDDGETSVLEGPKAIEDDADDFMKKISKLSHLQILQRAIQTLSNVETSGLLKLL